MKNECTFTIIKMNSTYKISIYYNGIGKVIYLTKKEIWKFIWVMVKGLIKK